MRLSGALSRSGVRVRTVNDREGRFRVARYRGRLQSDLACPQER